MKQFPLLAHILPVLREQKWTWAARMAAVDVTHIKQLGDEWKEARAEQYAIFEEALRQRLPPELRTKLLAFLDVDPEDRVLGCVHYVRAIVDLQEADCIGHAERLLRCLQTCQDNCFSTDDYVADNERWDRVTDEVQLHYDLGRRCLVEERRKREMEEYRLRRQQQEQQKERQRQREREREWERREQEARQREEERYWDEVKLSNEQEHALVEYIEKHQAKSKF